MSVDPEHLAAVACVARLLDGWHPTATGKWLRPGRPPHITEPMTPAEVRVVADVLADLGRPGTP